MKRREKGPGFLGTLKRPDGRISTEISIGVNIDGKEVQIPTLVPTLTQNEINYLLSGKKPTEAIAGKAVEHAQKRMTEGRSPFKESSKQGISKEERERKEKEKKRRKD